MVTKTERTKINHAVKAVIDGELEYTERRLELPADTQLCPGERLERIREVLTEIHEREHLERQDSYYDCSAEEFFSFICKMNNSMRGKEN
jgi:hypothetical protein